MAPTPLLDRRLAELLTELRGGALPSARNLLVTVFGDTVRPRGRPFAVRSLAELLSGFGTSERLVRTSLTRLADEQLVAVTRTGNRSFYGVHPEADQLFARAEERIYGRHAPSWDGRWTLVVIDGGSGTTESRAALRRELQWRGLGAVAPNVMASPFVGAVEVAAVMDHVAHPDGVLITRAEVEATGAATTDLELARQCAPVSELAERYQQLVTWFTPIADALEDTGPDVAPQAAYTVRVLAIACYRRVVLSDPLLPPELLPASWVGNDAHDLVARVYRHVLEASEQRVVDTADTPAGPLGLVSSPARFSIASAASQPAN